MTSTPSTSTKQHCAGCDSDRPCSLYVVTYIDQSYAPEVAAYCDDCAALARCNWSGEIESMRALELDTQHGKDNQ